MQGSPFPDHYRSRFSPGNPNTVGFLPLASRMDLPGEHREVSKPVAQAFSKGIPFQLPIIQ